MGISTSKKIHVKVIGVGGGGCNAINRMIQTCNQEDVEFIAVNTDQQQLNRSSAKNKIDIGKDLTKGLGTGGDPHKGRLAAEESRERLKQVLSASIKVGDSDGLDLVFITAAMGGGTGTGAAPVVAEIASELGALVIGVVAKPFTWEGPKRTRHAESGIGQMNDIVDAMIVTDNNLLRERTQKNTSLQDAFRLADEVLRQGVQGLLDIILVPGEINMDFADVRAIMKSSGFATFGIGEGAGANRATNAARDAIAHSLQEVPPYGAKGLLVNIMASEDELGLGEVQEVLEFMRQHAEPEAAIKHGVVYSQAMRDKIRVYVVATGLSAESQGMPKSNANPVQSQISTPIPIPQTPVAERPTAPLPTPVAIPQPVPEPVAVQREERPVPATSTSSIYDDEDREDIPPFLRGYRSPRARKQRPLSPEEAALAQDDNEGDSNGTLYIQG